MNYRILSLLLQKYGEQQNILAGECLSAPTLISVMNGHWGIDQSKGKSLLYIEKLESKTNKFIISDRLS